MKEQDSPESSAMANNLEPSNRPGLPHSIPLVSKQKTTNEDR